METSTGIHDGSLAEDEIEELDMESSVDLDASLSSDQYENISNDSSVMMGSPHSPDPQDTLTSKKCSFPEHNEKSPTSRYNLRSGNAAGQSTDFSRRKEPKNLNRRSIHEAPEEIEKKKNEAKRLKKRSRDDHDATSLHKCNEQNEDVAKAEESITEENEIDDQKTGRDSGSYVWCLAILFVILAILVSVSVWPQMISLWSKLPKENVSPVDSLVRMLKNLEEGSVQDPKLWRIIRSTMKRHIADNNPAAPAVIMLVSTEKSSKTMECLASKIAKAYSVRCDDTPPFHLDGKTCEGKSPDNAKEMIDEQITRAFEKHKKCAAVVSSFQSPPPAAMTVFYQFCENDNAPFKDVTLIFTLQVEHGAWDTDNRYLMVAEGEVPSPKLWDTIVDDYLHYSLGKRDGTGIMTTDMISGLLTRVTPAVAWVTEEENHLC